MSACLCLFSRSPTQRGEAGLPVPRGTGVADKRSHEP